MPSLATLPVELRTLILCQVADLNTLHSLIESCMAFYQAYSAAQKAVTLALATHLLEKDGVGLQELLGVIKASKVERRYDEQQLKAVQHFLDQHSKKHPVCQQELIDLSIEEIRQCLQIHRVATYFSKDLMRTMIGRNPVAGLLEGDIAEPPMEERRRLTMSIYHWELWERLFGPDIGGDPKLYSAHSVGSEKIMLDTT